MSKGSERKAGKSQVTWQELEAEDRLRAAHLSDPPALKLEQVIPLWELLHKFMHTEEQFRGDQPFIAEPDPVFQAEKELYLMLTYRLTLEATIARIEKTESPA